MGKVNINIFFCLNGDIWISFTEVIIEKSSKFHMAFVQIGELIGCHDDKKVRF